MISAFDVSWQTQSKNSAGSMPVGGYDCGANVWVEGDDILLYVDRSGSFDENNQMLKLGRFRVHVSPSPFSKVFRQTLLLEKGSILIEGDDHFRCEIWFHTDAPMMRMSFSRGGDREITIAYETWRFQDREVSDQNGRSAFSYQGYCGEVITRADGFIPLEDKLFFYHQNNNGHLLFDFLVNQQNLTSIRDELDNPQRDYVFGGIMAGSALQYVAERMHRYAGINCRQYWYRLLPAGDEGIHVAFCACNASLQEWYERVEQLSLVQSKRVDARETALSWWKQYWARSYVEINSECGSDDSGFQIARNYTLMRYMLGCNAYGSYPTKFNGGLFTTDPVYWNGPKYTDETPDYRRWGGGSFTAQNQRLVYWPMLKSGDFDMMPSQFSFYQRAMHNAELRTKLYWRHDGCAFPEQLENFGVPTGICWGFETGENKIHIRDAGQEPYELRCPWTRYEYVTALEFCYMILEYGRYSGQPLTEYMPLIDSCLKFYELHYEMLHDHNANRKLDRNGHWVIWPSTALETYKDAMNPTDVLSALTAVLGRLNEISTGEKKAKYEAMLKKVPPVATREMDGVKCISPAWSWSDIINCELPQLYPVYPYGIYGIGKEGLDLAKNTYLHGVDIPEQRGYESWKQEGIFAARLGLKKEALVRLKQKLCDGRLRFPAFWGPGYDWLPDHNWGGSGMICLQEMLIQAVDKHIMLLPTWPLEWTVTFRMHLPYQTQIEVQWDGSSLHWTIYGSEQYSIILPDGKAVENCRPGVKYCSQEL